MKHSKNLFYAIIFSVFAFSNPATAEPSEIWRCFAPDKDSNQEIHPPQPHSKIVSITDPESGKIQSSGLINEMILDAAFNRSKQAYDKNLTTLALAIECEKIDTTEHLGMVFPVPNSRPPTTTDTFMPSLKTTVDTQSSP